jgi:hypothetical protein
MCDEAANITDRIFPNAPVRQWVLSLPFGLRGLAATKPDVLTAMGRIFAEEVARATKRLAGVAGAETGSVSFPQRFGGSLNLHVHFHLLAVDGVFEKHGEGVRLHEAPPPAKDDVATVVQRVHDRALVWLRRHRYLDERRAEDRGNEPAADTPVDALARLALAGGTFLGRPFAPREHTGDDLDRKEPRFSAKHNGFDVHGEVRLAAGNDEGASSKPPHPLLRAPALRARAHRGAEGRPHRVPRPDAAPRRHPPRDDARGIPGASRDPGASSLLPAGALLRRPRGRRGAPREGAAAAGARRARVHHGHPAGDRERRRRRCHERAERAAFRARSDRARSDRGAGGGDGRGSRDPRRPGPEPGRSGDAGGRWARRGR